MPKTYHTTNLIKLLLLLLATQLLVSGCGFQLRGSGYDTAAGETIYVFSNEPYGDLERIIKAKLRAASISVKETEHVNEGAGSETVDFSNRLTGENSIRILEQKSTKEVISVDDNGRPAEYESVIFLKVNFTYSNGLQQQKNFSTRRDYRYDSKYNLAHDRELETVISEMRNELSDLLISQYLRKLSTTKIISQPDISRSDSQ